MNWFQLSVFLLVDLSVSARDRSFLVNFQASAFGFGRFRRVADRLPPRLAVFRGEPPWDSDVQSRPTARA